MNNLLEAVDVIMSDRKIVIYAKEQSCNRYPLYPSKPTPGCAECGLGEIFGRKYEPDQDFATLESDYRAFEQKAEEGAVSITLLGGEMLQDIVTKTDWPNRSVLIENFGIKPEVIKSIFDYRQKIGKPIITAEKMKMWERDALIPTAMISSLGMIPHITSNFDLLRQKKGKQDRLEEIVTQLKSAGLSLFNVSWHTKPGTTLDQNRDYFESLVKAIKYCERIAKIPTNLTRVFRGFKADPDIFIWQREVSNRYITNDISPAGIRSDSAQAVFYGSNQELKPTQEEIEILEIYHLLNAMAGDQPRTKTVFQAIFEGVLSETGWRCNPDEEHFEFIDVTDNGVRSGVCSEVRGTIAELFPQDKASRMQERVKLIHELCPSCLSRCYTYFEWRKFQKDILHIWHYAQAAGKIWRQMYGREVPFRHLVMKADDYLNPDLLERILQFRFRYFAKTLEDPEVVAMLKRSGTDPFIPLRKYYQQSVNNQEIISKLQSQFSGLPPFVDETSPQSRILREVAKIKLLDPKAAPVPWKYIWILRKENPNNLSSHYKLAKSFMENKKPPEFPREGIILGMLKLYYNFFFPEFSPKYSFNYL
ncbi:hypothetical protein A3J20_03235 [Candidatus Gottesmanbacteria bacterium RIFCSPLOWO2_02_FULL_42_29]|uniref:Uncharacterized protein n=2 Tax=Candidatus Gottesmaniibacteriota TaxID=1752720 RepID=A0A1F6B7Q8_9BACT|nr:MAG: hypothetical protein UV09_C0003G0007 [Candidatus Gottesmanbacteria bacterium GW2011_GWA2_42_18]KKS74334.1 MAG: hypothetical protein UV46_C0046G0003 [Candidatus Gottesmanbacteria bacterium GW2011_GWC2_42_8]OGG11009.1 MAG: hypothetical protein A2781_04085 [Candidatus Gottesmanbacteria bacterium RIFCSPHIGHO2_01_FULL_42_27]OGG22673.1 MAG: hypothetical protein A3E72_03535 [Candidatus Gottesmanbacteria bacterium RIFCSPHIGHO2_12_FULL_43_26]OGG32970.1 MAG: hypothetical protein A2968_06920 [Cand